MKTGISRRTALATGAALPVAIGTGVKTVGAQAPPTGDLITIPVDPRTGAPSSGLIVTDMATGTRSYLDLPPMDDLVAVEGAPFAVAHAAGEAFVVDAETATSTALAPFSDATDVPAALARVFTPGNPTQVVAAAGRWVVLLDGRSSRYLVDLRRATLADLAIELRVDNAPQIAAVIPGSDRLLVAVDDELRVVLAETLATEAVVVADEGMYDVALSPGGKRVSWMSQSDGGAVLTPRHAEVVASAPTDVGWRGEPGDHGFRWVDDDTGLVWRNTSDGADLHRIDVATGASAVLIALEGGTSGPWILANGTRALVSAEHDNVVRWSLLDLETGTFVGLPGLTNAELAAPVDRTTRAAIFDPYEPTRAERLQVLNAASGDVSMLVEAGRGTTLGRPLVAPGGRSAAVDATGVGTPGYDIARCELCDLARGTTVSIDQAAAASFSPDGRHLLTWTVDPATQSRTTLTLRILDGRPVEEIGRAFHVAWVG